jgi:hypothetical protein
VKDAVGSWGCGPFTVAVEESSPRGDYYEVVFTVEREGHDLGAAAAKLNRSAETMATNRGPNGASNVEAGVRAGFVEIAKACLEEELLNGDFTDRLTPAHPVGFLEITSSDDELIDRLAGIARPAC